MSAVLSLVRKEIRQTRGLFIALAVFSAIISWMQILFLDINQGLISYLSLGSLYSFPVLCLVAYIIGNHLVSKEYYGRTQRFLEALPIRRVHMAAVKYAVGYGILIVLVGGVWLYSVSLARSSEPVSQRFIALMAVRLLVYVFALWSVVFTFSLLGRLRIPVLAASIFLLILLNEYTAFELMKFGPLALIDNDLFTSERNIFPVKQIMEGLVIGAGFTFLGFFLVKKNDGSLTETLAVPMTGREKSFLLVILIVGLGIYSYFGPEPEETPFSFSNRFVESGHRVRVAYIAPEFRDQARSLLNELSKRVDSLEELFPVPDDQFTIQVSLAPTADPRDYQTQMASAKQGMLVTANYLESPRWSFDYFSAFIIHQMLGIRTKFRVIMEPRHWMLDGFALWWTRHYDPLADDGLAYDPYMVAAIYATGILPLERNTIAQWEITTDHLGDGMAMALGYSGWQVLRELEGFDAARQLAVSEFSRPAYGDVRDWWADWLNPLAERFQAGTGMSWEAFMIAWHDALVSLAREPLYREQLTRLPHGDLTISPQISPTGVRLLEYHLSLDSPLPPGSRCLALHTALPGYDVPVPREVLREVEVFAAEIAAGTERQLEFELFNQYGSDQRIYASLECDIPGLGFPLRFGFARVTML